MVTSRRLIISDEDLLKGAQAIAADLQLPDGGRIKLARIVDGHLDWFERARGRGLEWSDIVAVLARAGATRSDGRPLSRGHVSSLVWRKQQEANKFASVPVIDTREALAPATVVKRSKRTNGLGEIGLPAAEDTGKPAMPKKRQVRSARGSAAGVRPLPESDHSSGSELHRTNHDDLLAAMRRAARVRRDG